MPSWSSIRRPRRALLALAAVALFTAGCEQKWDTEGRGVDDEELEIAFFSGLESSRMVELPEPTNLRPCCVFGNDVGVGIGSVPVPGYEIRNVLGAEDLGTHSYNKGLVELEPRGVEGVLSDEASGMLYTCRAGFIDIAHVRDNADRTLYLASRIAALAATGGIIPIVDEGGKRRIVLQPLDKELVARFGLREVVASLAEWIDYEASIWHEVATWYGWSSTTFSERPSAFSIEDLYSNLLGAKVAATVIRRHGAGSEIEYNTNVTAVLRDAMAKLGALPREASRRAFQYVDGIWWDSTKRVPDNTLVRHRNFGIGPRLLPWKIVEAAPSDVLSKERKQFDSACQGDWDSLVLTVRDSLGGIAFPSLATLEIEPEPALFEKGLRSERTVTQRDFAAIVAEIEKAAEAELGPGVGRPAARPGETSRYHPDSN